MTDGGNFSAGHGSFYCSKQGTCAPGQNLAAWSALARKATTLVRPTPIVFKTKQSKTGACTCLLCGPPPDASRYSMLSLAPSRRSPSRRSEYSQHSIQHLVFQQFQRRSLVFHRPRIRSLAFRPCLCAVRVPAGCPHLWHPSTGPGDAWRSTDHPNVWHPADSDPAHWVAHGATDACGTPAGADRPERSSARRDGWRPAADVNGWGNGSALPDTPAGAGHARHSAHDLHAWHPADAHSRVRPASRADRPARTAPGRLDGNDARAYPWHDPGGDSRPGTLAARSARPASGNAQLPPGSGTSSGHSSTRRFPSLADQLEGSGFQNG